MPINPSFISATTDDFDEEAIFGSIIIPAIPAIPEFINCRLDHFFF
jgi:hypothetical protein